MSDIEVVLNNTGWVEAYNACKRAVGRWHFNEAGFCPECALEWPCRTWRIFEDNLVARRSTG